MKSAFPIVLLAGFLMCGSAPAPRASGLNIPTAQSMDILAACIQKRLGDSKTVDLPGGGVSIQYGEYKSLLIHRSATLYFDLTEVAGNRNIAVSYRHPLTKGSAAKTLRQVGRKCFAYELEAAGGGVLPDAG